VENLTVTHSSGWDKTITDMTVGEKSEVTIPA
jgi:FKBP-type peptidyl-prolyl cis-trans isomerase